MLFKQTEPPLTTRYWIGIIKIFQYVVLYHHCSNEE